MGTVSHWQASVGTTHTGRDKQVTSTEQGLWSTSDIMIDKGPKRDRKTPTSESEAEEKPDRHKSDPREEWPGSRRTRQMAVGLRAVSLVWRVYFSSFWVFLCAQNLFSRTRTEHRGKQKRQWAPIIERWAPKIGVADLFWASKHAESAGNNQTDSDTVLLCCVLLCWSSLIRLRIVFRGTPVVCPSLP